MTQGGRDAGDLKPAGRRGGGVLERLRKTAGASETAVGDPDAPSVPDRAEHRLLVVPPDPAQLEVVVPAKRKGSGRGDPTVHQDQLKSPGEPCWVRCSSISSLARFSWVEAGTTRSIASITRRRSGACLGPRLPGRLNTGPSSAHCSVVRSLEYDIPHTVPTKPATAVTTKWDTPS
ncbi:MAG: hypothetical protein QOE58_1206 [Actinomycetota bacterium]|nr:hypothetical protein [Actinomycetota bacterium]